MIRYCAVSFLLLFLGCGMVVPVGWSQTNGNSAAPETPTLNPAPPVTEVNGRTNGVFHPITPGPLDGQIAFFTAAMLERYHYLQLRFNSALSPKFFERYLETLDPQHLYFLQSDLAEFDRYRTNLNRQILPPRGSAPDVRPACDIFNRFFQRLEQRVAYSDEILRTEKFTFEGDDRVVINRKDLSYPKDLEEAKKLWREQLKAQYLQERLAKMDARKKVTPSSVKPPEKEPGKDTPADASNAASVSAGATTNSSGPVEVSARKTEAEEIVETLSHRYHRILRNYLDWNKDDVLQAYLTALTHVYDPHSDYFGPAQLEQFSIQMNLSLSGIGAELTTTEDGYCTIRRLLPGYPAEKSGKIMVNDRIIKVAQSNQPPVDVVDMNLNKAVQLIRGPQGTEVRLTLIPAGADATATKTVSLTRAEIQIEDQEAKAKIIDLPNGSGESLRLGVINLPSFYTPFEIVKTRGQAEPRSTTTDVARLLTKLKQENVGGVILDLRLNGGGSLEEAIKLTGLFIKEGPIVQVRSSPAIADHVEKLEDKDSSVLYEGPLIVLTSRLSASASEILAGALQDYGRALIVGDNRTHGKGTVQQVLKLQDTMVASGVQGITNEPGALKVTIKKFYRASGASTQKEGVAADLVLPSILGESKEIGESSLENPLDYDTIPSAKYDRLDLVEPYLPELRKRSTQRLATDKEYAYIREDIALYNKQQADKTMSLNEQQRLKEKEEADVRQKARDKERKARPEPAEKVYELTRKQAELPGLPPPVTKTNSALARTSLDKPAGTSVVSTNTAFAAKDTPAPAAPDVDVDPDDERPPALDAALAEAEHILADYISLLPKPNVAAAAGH
jgi:carboxyl-terminal processing protease